MTAGIISSFLPALLRGQRSTVLNTLGWMMLLLIVGLLGSVSVHAQHWVQAFFAVMAGVTFITFIGAYVYFAAKNPDALRSEGFTIQKLAIEHRLVGDKGAGVFPDDEEPSISLPADQSKQIEHKA